MSLRHTIDYFKNFFKDKKVASVTPCSRYTIHRLCDRLDFGQTQVIVEYGPGTGNFSEYLLNQLNNDSRFILIELMEDFVRELEDHFGPDSRVGIYQDVAENLTSILEKERIQQVDAVLSGIPFSMLTDAKKHEVLKQTHHFLKPGGQFLVYQTSYKMVPYLKQYFSQVNKDFEPRNLPPMYLMEAFK